MLFDVPPYRDIVTHAWEDLPSHYPCVSLDAFVVMPNHVHGIIVLTEGGSVGAGFKPAPTQVVRRHGLPEVVRGFKTFSARRINALRGTTGVPVWQRNYYEHVIRGEDELERIREYICSNPSRWDYDRENPSRAGVDEKEVELWELLGQRDLGVAAGRD